MAKEMREKAKEIAEELRKKDNFAVIHHYDADGIAAGAIACKMLQGEGKEVKAKAVKQLYNETIEEIRGLGETYVFVDFGSGQMRLLQKEFGKNFFVMDHHQQEETGERHEFELNPYQFGVNGGTEISGAGTTYFVARELNKKNRKLSALAVVGAVGDMQDFRGKLEGVNAEIVNEAVEEGVMEKKIDLRLYGRISRPLAQFLEFSSNPIIPGLTANEENCKKFLSQAGIGVKEESEGGRWRSYEDLSAAEKKKLSSALIEYMYLQNVKEWKIREMIGEIYTLIGEERKSPLRDAKETATLFNSCGRHGMAEVALAVAMGDRQEKYSQALGLLVEHRKQLREGIQLIKGKGVEEFESFYFFDAGKEVKDSIVGIIAGMLYDGEFIQPNKPVIAMARHSDGTVKVSARATSELVRNGLNLGKILKEACEEIGDESEGGGHKIAAGCKIKEKNRERFLEVLGEKIKSSRL
ncbi:MAG: DHH family phosphoesterase [Candidatus Diapherotrites archaeon]